MICQLNVVKTNILCGCKYFLFGLILSHVFEPKTLRETHQACVLSKPQMEFCLRNICVELYFEHMQINVWPHPMDQETNTYPLTCKWPSPSMLSSCSLPHHFVVVCKGLNVAFESHFIHIYVVGSYLHIHCNYQSLISLSYSH